MNTSTLTIEKATQAITPREPIFHRPELGTTRADFDAMVAPQFWEVGASGRKYSKRDVLDVLEARHTQPAHEDFSLSDFACLELAADLYLATYQLTLANRVSRRATIWRHTDSKWQIVYHQGTLVQA